MNKNPVIGSIIGDIIGSRFEKSGKKSKEFDLFTEKSIFTDDTVLTMAVLKSNIEKTNYLDNIVDFSRRYPNRGYGGRYIKWLNGDTSIPYNSFGNGSAMRVSSIPLFSSDLDELFAKTKASADVSHNHEKGVLGANAISFAIHLALHGLSQTEIKDEMVQFYDFNFTIDEIRENYEFSATCDGTIPESLVCFFESTSYEDCIRTAISLGGDTDTMAAMSGGIAAVYFGIPEDIVKEGLSKLPQEFLDLLNQI